MQWLLLNQHFVNLGFRDSKMCVLEEVVSSGLQLVSVLVSGTVSVDTMNLHGHGHQSNNLEYVRDLSLE